MNDFFLMRKEILRLDDKTKKKEFKLINAASFLNEEQTRQMMGECKKKMSMTDGKRNF